MSWLVQSQNHAELARLASEAFCIDATVQVKRTCLQMFTRVLDGSDHRLVADLVNVYMPKLIEQVNATDDMLLIVDCLNVVDSCALKVPSMLLMPFTKQV